MEFGGARVVPKRGRFAGAILALASMTLANVSGSDTTLPALFRAAIGAFAMASFHHGQGGGVTSGVSAPANEAKSSAACIAMQ